MRNEFPSGAHPAGGRVVNPLGHIAVASGAVWLGAEALERALGRRDWAGRETGSYRGPRASGAGMDTQGAAGGGVEWRRLTEKIDYRLVMIGALLPDLIDKPVGKMLFRGPLDNNGHVYGHTLLFALVVMLLGMYVLARKDDPRLIAVGVAVLTHLAFDPVNHAPQSLLWPLLGIDFPKSTFLGTRATIFTETAAALSMLLVAALLGRQGRLRAFMRTGLLQPARRTSD